MRLVSKCKYGFRLKNGGFFITPPNEIVEAPEEIKEDKMFNWAVSADKISIFSEIEKPVDKKKKKV